MKILELKELNELFLTGSVVTLGNFDGVHRGHLAILQALERSSEITGLPSVLVTYYPHPALVLGKTKDLKYIYSETKKREILSQFKINYLLTISFTLEFSQKKALEFIEEILVNALKAKHIVIGYNHFFGKDQEGDFTFLKNCASQYGFSVEQIPPVFFGSQKISSSQIRNLILQGEIEKANEMLGRPFSLRGIVVEGDKRGSQISFPTANLIPPQDCVYPANGVYAAHTVIQGRRYASMINIGYRPTFQGTYLTIEAHILDFKGNLYGEEIEHYFLYKIRNEKKFESVGELISQLHRDKQVTQKILRQNAQMAQQ